MKSPLSIVSMTLMEFRMCGESYYYYAIGGSLRLNWG